MGSFFQMPHPFEDLGILWNRIHAYCGVVLPIDLIAVCRQKSNTCFERQTIDSHLSWETCCYEWWWQQHPFLHTDRFYSFLTHYSYYLLFEGPVFTKMDLASYATDECPPSLSLCLSTQNQYWRQLKIECNQRRKWHLMQRILGHLIPPNHQARLRIIFVP